MTLLEGRKNIMGLSLVELLIAMAINIFLIGVLVLVFSKFIGQSNQQNTSEELNSRLTSAMDSMISGIRRAGYWANAYTDINTKINNNPFMTANTDIQTDNNGSCILFSYDANGNGSLPGISSSYDDERYGYRLVNGAIQGRPFGSTFSCNAAPSSWENLTDPSIVTITKLSFVVTKTKLYLSESNSAGIEIRNVDITLTGRLVNNTAVTQTLTQHVRVRNDKYLP